MYIHNYKIYSLRIYSFIITAIIILLYCTYNYYHMIYQLDQNQSNQTQIRKLQGIHGNSTYTIVLPKDFISILNLSKGDYLKCRISNHQLIIEKAEV